jgi:hypothetical protein
MLIDEIKSKLIRPCQQFGVKWLDLFGSYARGEQRTDSDLDFVVEFDAPSPKGAFDRFFGLLEALEDEFKVKIDLLEARAVKNPYLHKTIERDRVRLYG